MLFEALETARDLGRLHEIASVLVRHGLGDLVRRVGLATALERAGRVLHWKAPERLAGTPAPVHLRSALEELGPTFVKLGQVLAGREDLLGPTWTEELTKLQEHVAPVPFERIREELAADLGAPPEDVFDEIDPEPMASASIAQVHRARLADGSDVVLKVRRPGIREVVDADLRLLTRLAERVENEVPDLRRYRPRLFVRHFARTLRAELDLRLEARHAERLRTVLSREPGIHVPAVYGEWTGERLLVLERVHGKSLGALLREGSLEPEHAAELARRGADAFLRMVFVDRFFHADPHPGNVVLEPDGRLALLDFGMVGRLTEQRRREIFGLLGAVARRDENAAVDVLLEWSHGDEVDVGLLTDDCAAFLDHYSGSSLEAIDVGSVLRDIAAIVRENDLYLPPDVASLLKVLVTLESLGRALDPDFVMSEHVAPFARREMRRLHSPRRLFVRAMRGVEWALRGLPEDARRVLRGLRRGRVHVDVQIRHLEDLGRRIDRSASRVTLGLVTAALIVGTAVSLQVPSGPRLLGFPLIGLLGFVSSLVAGIWVIWSILRSDRP